MNKRTQVLECRDTLFHIKSFLDNRDIVELMVSSKRIRQAIGHKNVFTSLSINRNDNMCDMIRLYLMHKTSIQSIVFIRCKESEEMWPFPLEKYKKREK